MAGLSDSCDSTDVIALYTGLPFYEHFYSLGVRDLRGYDDNTLGPKDSVCRFVRGDLNATGGSARVIPRPFAGGRSRTLRTLRTEI